LLAIEKLIRQTSWVWYCGTFFQNGTFSMMMAVFFKKEPFKLVQIFAMILFMKHQMSGNKSVGTSKDRQRLSASKIGQCLIKSSSTMAIFHDIQPWQKEFT